MSTARLRFCIVTTAHICDNPRVVKEADALAAAGHDVRVVSHDAVAHSAERDAIVMRGRAWRLDAVAIHRRTRPDAARWAYASLRHTAARALHDRGVPGAAVRDLAVGKHMPRMAAAAAAEPADVIVAHHAQALPAAARAAERIGASLAFDFEDYHVGNVEPGPGAAREMARIEATDRAYLHRCRAIVASSGPIADAVASRYALRAPTVVLNTFPANAAAQPTTIVDRADGPPSFYWFSQTVGPNRGLEDAVVALARAQIPAQLHLRGTPRTEFVERLRALAAEHRSLATLHVHGPALPHELPPLAAQHDVGLALEPPVHANSTLALSNKLLTYFIAGNAVVATDTPGQRSALDAAPGAGAVYRSGDVDALAAILRRYAADGPALAAARAASRAAADRRFSWEHDAPVLVAALEGAAA